MTFEKRICRVCGNQFYRTKYHVFCCSSKCNKIHNPPELNTILCEQCGEYFQAKTVQKQYCSQRCRDIMLMESRRRSNAKANASGKYYKPKIRIPKPCVICGKQFMPMFPRHINCSKICGKIRQSNLDKIRVKERKK